MNNRLLLPDLPKNLSELKTAAIPGLEMLAYELFKSALQTVDASGDKALTSELNHVLKDNVYKANFAVVLGHAANLPNIGGDGLDVGCSVGLKTLIYKHFGATKLMGCDVIAPLIEAANNWRRQTGVEDLSFVHNPPSTLGFPDASFEWVSCMGLYANLSEAATAGLFAECFRVLKPGGRLVFHDGANPLHPESAQRTADYHRQLEIGQGTQERPAGPLYIARLDLLNERLGRRLNSEDAAVLARSTCYMTESNVLKAGEAWLADGRMPESYFVDGDIRRPPIRLDGLPGRRVTDPFVIRNELEEVGFSNVRYRRPILGALVELDDEAEYFSKAPGLFLNADKSADARGTTQA